MDFYLFAVKFMVNCQSICKLLDQKIKNIYLNLFNFLRFCNRVYSKIHSNHKFYSIYLPSTFWSDIWKSLISKAFRKKFVE